MTITPDLVRQLRQATGAGILDAKQALEKADGDLAAATTILRKHGQRLAATKASRTSSEGIIETYLHPNRRIGVLVDVRCETDFVARNADFQAFVHELALQIAATNPRYLHPEDIPAAVLGEERAIARQQAKGKPRPVVEKIVSGKLEKFYAEVCLLKQPSIRDDQRTVEELLQEIVAKVGERVVIRRFVRFSLEEG